MKFRNFFAGAFIGVCFCALPCLAADIYISQAAQGSDTGADAADAHSIIWLNNPANWGSGSNQVYSGTTVHFCGIITNSLTMAAGGAPGNPITFYFEPNAMFSAPTWINPIVTGASYITIDGGSNGVIQATANGTGLLYSNNITGIYAPACTGVTIENLTIQNLYINIAGSDENGGAGAGVYFVGSGMCNDVVTNCNFSNEYQGAEFAFETGCSNFVMTHCFAQHCNWGGGCGAGNSAATLNGMTVDHNHFWNWANWDDNSDYWHHNGFYAYADSGYATNVVYSANYVGPGFGSHNTSGLFVSGNISVFSAYNNIFDASDGTSPANALLYISNATTTTNLIANNTFIQGYTALEFYGSPPNYGATPTYWRCFNNEFYSNVLSVSIFYDNNTNSSHLTNTNNFYGSSQFNATQNGGGNIISLAIFQSYGFDQNSFTQNPNLNGSWQPQAGSALIGQGMNLTSFGITNDYAGNARPSSGNWTLGAYQVGAATISPVISVKPTNPVIGAVAVNTTTNETFTVQNIGGGTLIGSPSVTAPYSIISGATYSLTAGQSTNVVISYSPMTVGINTQVVTFSGGGGASTVINGAAVMPPPMNLQPHAPSP